MLRERAPGVWTGHGSLMAGLADSLANAHGAAADGLRLVLLGAPSLRAGARVIALARKDAALLAILALDGPTAAARLAALLWPDVDEKQAANNLRQRIFRLRKAAGQRLIEVGAVLRLAEAVTADLDDAVAAVEAGTDAGDLLAGLNFDDHEELDAWLQAARGRWRARYADALAAAASRRESAGEVAQALHLAQRLLAQQPLAEHAHRRLMRLHYLRGDRAAALAAYARCRDELRRELQAEPGRETRELAALIERSGALAPAAAPRPVAVLRPPRLVGRDGEWQQLRQAWAAARIALVTGDPGVGKTRLLADFAAAQGAGVVVCGARPGDARVAYSALARLLRAALQSFEAPAPTWVSGELARIAPELGAPAAGRLEPLRLRQALQAAFEGWSAAGLRALLIDDLQFADAASLEALLPLAAGLGALRWLIGLRAGEVPDAVAQWAQELGADSLQRIALAPLTPAGTEDLLRALALPGVDAAAWAPSLHRHTGGNPLFLLETLGTLAAAPLPPPGAPLPVPANIGQLIENRLAQLSPEALKLARVAALAGPDFSAALAAEVLGRDALDLAEPWRELEAAQVIRDDAFAHDLIFEATLRTVPKPIAGLLHRSIAEFLAAHGAAAARVALHWAEAGEWSRSAQAFASAAREARRGSSRAAEVEYWNRAVDGFDHAGDAEAAFEARCASVDSLLLVNGVARARAVIDALLRDARTPAQRVAALTAQATAQLLAADHAHGLDSARAACELAGTLDSPWPRFEAARLYAVSLAQSEGRAAEALPVIESFRDLVEREGDAEQRCKFWADYAYVLNCNRRLRATAQALENGIAVARELADYGELATMTSNLAQVRANLGQIDLALDQALQSRALRARLGETSGPAGGAIDMYVGWLSGAIGRYRDALRALDDALACFARDAQTLWTAVAANHRAVLLLDLGQVTRAQQALQYALPAMDSVRARRALLAGRIERLLGRSGAAQASEAAAILGEHGDPYMTMLVQLDLADTLEPAEAEALSARVQDTADAMEYAGIALKARLRRARHRHRGGDARAAAGLLRDALASFGGVQPADLYRPDMWWSACEIFAAAGEREAAREALARAARWVREAAAQQVPDEFRDSFLNRNPVNRAILAAASRHGLGVPGG